MKILRTLTNEVIFEARASSMKQLLQKAIKAGVTDFYTSDEEMKLMAEEEARLAQ